MEQDSSPLSRIADRQAAVIDHYSPPDRPDLQQVT